MLQYDYSQAITAAMAKAAIQTIILRRDSHIDSLLERLKEERVRRMIEPLIYGEDVPELPKRARTDCPLCGYIWLQRGLARRVRPAKRQDMGGENILQTGTHQRNGYSCFRDLN